MVLRRCGQLAANRCLVAHLLAVLAELHVCVCVCVSQDTAKKTKWVVELVQGIMADHDAATEDAQTQHSAELVRSNRLTY